MKNLMKLLGVVALVIVASEPARAYYCWGGLLSVCLQGCDAQRQTVAERCPQFADAVTCAVTLEIGYENCIEKCYVDSCVGYESN